MTNDDESRTTPPGLGAEPGLCGGCRFAHLTTTRRGTAYLRCLRAATDDRFVKYPRLPVTSCSGFIPGPAESTEA